MKLSIATLAFFGLVSYATAAAELDLTPYNLECKDDPRDCIPVVDAQGNKYGCKEKPPTDDDDDDNDRDLDEDPLCPKDDEGIPQCDKSRAYTWGDPHLTTFDEFEHDCQTLGDHVYMRSPNSDFEIQARYGKPSDKGEFLSWAIGLVVRGDTLGAPKIEVSLNTPFQLPDGNGCAKSIIIDGQVVSGDPNTFMTAGGYKGMKFQQVDSDRLDLIYNSGLTVELKNRARGHFGCSFTTTIWFPDYLRSVLAPFGLMGTPDGDKSNEWTLADSSIMPIPGGGEDKVYSHQAANFCRSYCLTNAADSLFDYTASSHQFSDWENCSSGPGSGGGADGDSDPVLDDWLRFIAGIEANNPEYFTMCADAAIQANNPSFDQQDCLLELVSGSPIQDIIDDFEAKWIGNLGSTGVIACGDRSNGSCRNNFGANDLFARKGEEYAIACCKDRDPLQPWLPPQGYSVTNANNDGCIAKGNYNVAFQACDGKGMRMCTKGEILDLVLDGSQGSDVCNLATEMVWTSSIPTGQLVPNQWHFCGRTDGCGGAIGELVDGSKDENKAFVRCCSGQQIIGWRAPNTASPKCAGIYSQSEFSPCSGKKTYEEAVEFCVKEGGYLCSREELRNDCAAHSGCGYDYEYVWAMDQSLVEIVPPPTVDPFDELDSKEKKWLACGNSNQLDCVKKEGAVFVVDVVSEMHEVKCCKVSSSDESGDGWITNGQDWVKSYDTGDIQITANPKCANIWAKSQVGHPEVDGGCVHSASYEAAAGYCGKAGGQVCTLDMIRDGCTAHSGDCSHDEDLIWTTETADESTIEDDKMAWVACGRQGQCADFYGLGAKLSPVMDKHEVRCCATTQIDNNWRNNPWCDVWSESEIKGNCYHSETYFGARDICEKAGGRLCTKEEVLADCTFSSGCDHDKDFIWTSDRGWKAPFVAPPDTRSTDDKYLLVCADIDNEDCMKIDSVQEHFAPTSEEHEVVCCSDQAGLVAPWEKESALDSCNVFATARDPATNGCFPSMTLPDALAKCASLPGGRLCSRHEVMSRCTKSAAASCSVHGDLVWTNEKHDETTQGALKEGRWVTCGGVNKCSELFGATSMMIDHTVYDDPQLYHNVRCCSDFEISGWRNNPGCNVWAESHINGICIYASNYEEAEAACSAPGARLCEKWEVLSHCAASTGCSRDYELIWTKTPAFFPPDQSVEKFVTLGCGASDAGECTRYEGSKKAIVSSRTKHEVRCCSDTQFDATWRQGSASACSGVYSKSKLPVCYHAATYDEATQICGKYGARLCSPAEVESGCADDADGCGHDVDLVWTNEEVPKAGLVERKQTVCGKRGGNCKDSSGTLIGAMVVDLSHKAAVRCCSSKALPGFRDSICPGLWVQSAWGSDCSKDHTYDQATAVCKSIGARLCTKSELVSNCAVSSGCGLDHRMSWAYDSAYEKI